MDPFVQEGLLEAHWLKQVDARVSSTRVPANVGDHRARIPWGLWPVRVFVARWNDDAVVGSVRRRRSHVD
jgi:hypothetical protein